MLPWLREPGVRYVCACRATSARKRRSPPASTTPRGDVVLLMDADLQHPPALIPSMLAAWRDGADMVVRRARSRADERLLKRLGHRALLPARQRATRRSQIPADAGDFRLMDRAVVDALKRAARAQPLHEGPVRLGRLPHRGHRLRAGRAHRRRQPFSLRRLARLAFTGVTAFTNFAAAPVERARRGGRASARSATASGIVIEHFLHGSDVAGLGDAGRRHDVLQRRAAASRSASSANTSAASSTRSSSGRSTWSAERQRAADAQRARPTRRRARGRAQPGAQLAHARRRA